GNAGALLAYGATAEAAMEAAERLAGEGLQVAVASARFAKPLDSGGLESLLESQPWVLSIEDHTAPGGFGSAVMEAAEARGLAAAKIHRAAVPDEFIEHGAREAQLSAAGLTAERIAQRARTLA
ncbi:MAG: transketolase C-terminal domain-containing protein, partial [Phycisphaerae bacterium]